MFICFFVILLGNLENGIRLASYEVSHTFETYESDVLFVLRFMIDTDIKGGNWIKLPSHTYQIEVNNRSRCQLEAHIHYKDIKSLSIDGEYGKIAPFRLLSFDIECAARKVVKAISLIRTLESVVNLIICIVCISQVFII